MKTKYCCDKCGKEFDTEKECLQHERKCSKVDVLERKVKELEERLDVLEKYWDIAKTPPCPSYPTAPSCPTVPTYPIAPQPIWCQTTPTCNMTNINVDEEKKTDSK